MPTTQNGSHITPVGPRYRAYNRMLLLDILSAKDRPGFRLLAQICDILMHPIEGNYHISMQKQSIAVFRVQGVGFLGCCPHPVTVYIKSSVRDSIYH